MPESFSRSTVSLRGLPDVQARQCTAYVNRSRSSGWHSARNAFDGQRLLGDVDGGCACERRLDLDEVEPVSLLSRDVAQGLERDGSARVAWVCAVDELLERYSELVGEPAQGVEAPGRAAPTEVMPTIQPCGVATDRIGRGTSARSPLRSRGACRSSRFLSLRSARPIAALMTTAAGRKQAQDLTGAALAGIREASVRTVATGDVNASVPVSSQ